VRGRQGVHGSSSSGIAAAAARCPSPFPVLPVLGCRLRATSCELRLVLWLLLLRLRGCMVYAVVYSIQYTVLHITQYAVYAVYRAAAVPHAFPAINRGFNRRRARGLGSACACAPARACVPARARARHRQSSTSHSSCFLIACRRAARVLSPASSGLPFGILSVVHHSQRDQRQRFTTVEIFRLARWRLRS
jgi:hypothetical protein